MANLVTKESPFSPGKPVSVEYFVARSEEIQRLDRAVKQTKGGSNQNLFIMGERGIGKSSLAGIIHYLAEKEHDFIGSHCYLGGVRTLETMTRVIFQRLFQELTDKSLFEKLREVFGQYIRGVTLFGFGVDFTKNESELLTLLENFQPAVRKVYDTVKDTKKGLVLILDDLNGITTIPEFSEFLKSFVDELATARDSLPLLLILVGIPERRDDLIKHQPSVARIFDIIELRPMSEAESQEFFTNTFDKQGMSIEPEALSLMVRLSGGFPMLMHEVGDAIFWKDGDGNIDKHDAKEGLLQAAEIVGMKYLDRQVYRALRSDTYRSILRKIGKVPLGATFQRKEVRAKIPEKERKGFDNFLTRMKKLGVICETEILGEYRFINELYHLSIRLEAFKAEKERVRK